MNTSSRGRRTSSFMVAWGPSLRASLESTPRRVKRSEGWRAARAATILACGVGGPGDGDGPRRMGTVGGRAVGPAGAGAVVDPGLPEPGERRRFLLHHPGAQPWLARG